MTFKKFNEDTRKALFESIINNSDDAIITKTLDGIITSWNKSAEALFGYTYDEIVGRHVSVIIPNERLNEEQHIIDNIRAGKHVRHYETERKCKDGSIVSISLTVSPLKDIKGVITGASKIARDITRQKQEEARLKVAERTIMTTLAERNTILESIDDAFFAVDKNWTVTYWNKRAEQVLGRPKTEVLLARLRSRMTG